MATVMIWPDLRICSRSFGSVISRFFVRIGTFITIPITLYAQWPPGSPGHSEMWLSIISYLYKLFTNTYLAGIANFDLLVNGYSQSGKFFEAITARIGMELFGDKHPLGRKGFIHHHFHKNRTTLPRYIGFMA